MSKIENTEKAVRVLTGGELKRFAMVGKIVEIGELTPYNEEPGSTVLNMKIEVEETNKYGMVLEAERRIVLFHRTAEKASKELKLGEYVFLDECSENPGEYVSKKGMLVKTVDIISNIFAKLKDKKSFDELKILIDTENAKERAAQDQAVGKITFAGMTF